MKPFLRLKNMRVENVSDAFLCAQPEDPVIAASLSHPHISCGSAGPILGVLFLL